MNDDWNKEEAGEELSTTVAPDALDASDVVDVLKTSDAAEPVDSAGDVNEIHAGSEAAEAGTVPEGEETPPDGEEDAGGEAGEADGDAAAGTAEEMQLPLPSVVEAVLFAAREPLKLIQIARAAGRRVRQDAVRAAIDELNVTYLESGRAFEIAEISGRYQFMSRPEYAHHIRRVYPKDELEKKAKAVRLGPAVLETLSIIAYKQPVTRGEIEHIRGVACGPAMKTLMERDLIRTVGKKDVVGSPMLFGTSDSFLVEFGLGSLDELPLRNEFARDLDLHTFAPPPVPVAEGDTAATPETAATAETGTPDAAPVAESEAIPEAVPEAESASEGEPSPEGESFSGVEPSPEIELFSEGESFPESGAFQTSGRGFSLVSESEAQADSEPNHG